MLDLSGGAALVIGHPGHELRVHGWLERAKPHVLVLSDGSGRCGKPRLDSTTAVLNAAGAIAGSVFGRYPDRELYDCLLQKRFDFFLSLAAEIAAFLVEREIHYVVGDRAEGYNTVHDTCRLVINAALDFVLQTTGQELPSYDFAVAELSAVSEIGDCETICFELNDAELGRKIAAALNYRGLEQEVEAELSQHGQQAHRYECFRRVLREWWFASAEGPRYYEKHARQVQRAGHYREVITYREHIAPLAEAMQRWSKSPSRMTV